MAYWKCYYHIIFGTKNRQAIIKPEHELLIFTTIEKKAGELKSQVLAINGMPDHIHIAMTIHPSQSVAQTIGQLKGASSREINRMFVLETPFQWQEGYGVLSFHERDKAIILNYITHQKQHHTDGTLWHGLEEYHDD